MVKFLTEEADARIDLTSANGLALLLRLLMKYHLVVVCFLVVKSVLRQIGGDERQGSWLREKIGKRHSFAFSCFAMLALLFIPLFVVVFVYVKLIALCIRIF